MKMKISIFLTGLIVATLIIAGCEFGRYPLIIDSSVESGPIPVNLDSSLPTQVVQSATVSIAELREVTGEEVDSMRFYNLTLLINNNTSPDGAAITGTMSVNGILLATLTGVPLSEFLTERSIFDKNLITGGFQYHPAGVTYLLGVLKTQTPDLLVVSVSAGTDASALHFDLNVKLYGQLFTSTN